VAWTATQGGLAKGRIGANVDLNKDEMLFFLAMRPRQ